MSQWERLVWIDSQIRQNRYPNAEDVAETFNVSRRQAFLDRQYLSERLGAPIAYSRSRRGWYYTDNTWALPALILQQAELTAFLLTLGLSRRYLGPPFEEAFASALEKIRSHLPDTVTVRADALSSVVSFTGAWQADVDADLLLGLNRAAVGRRRVKLTYYSATTNETTERVVDPYHLNNVRGEWYLIGFCHLRKDFRNFRLNRIQRWEMLRETFDPSPDFDLQSYLSQGFLAEHGGEPMNVVVRFDEFRARWVRGRRYHPTQEVEDLPDGGLILRMRTSAFHEVLHWVLSFGAEAEVLEPEHLRNTVADIAKRMAAMYDK
ncbi:MAG: helix-turn-helix transcriptional regulator [Armatimonadota bacterium]